MQTDKLRNPKALSFQLMKLSLSITENGSLSTARDLSHSIYLHVATGLPSGAPNSLTVPVTGVEPRSTGCQLSSTGTQGRAGLLLALLPCPRLQSRGGHPALLTRCTLHTLRTQ